MSLPVARLADMVVAGVITGPCAKRTFVNALPVSLLGDLVSPHGEPPHTNPVIANGTTRTLIEGLPVTLMGFSMATCMHPVSSGSPNTFIGPI